MATRAARHAAALAKRAKRLEEERQTGLLAQEKDRLKRDEIKHQAAKRAKAVNERNAAILAAAQIAKAPKPETPEEN